MSLLDRRIDQILKEFATYVRQYNAKFPSGTDYNTLLQFFRNNVAEIVFERRNEPDDRKIGHRYDQRRMLCTANWELIKTPIASKADLFRWKQPVNKRRGLQWYKKRKLFIVWDLMLLDWRTIPQEDITLISFFPLGGTRQEVAEKQLYFTQFYKRTLNRTSESTKLEYGDRVSGIRTMHTVTTPVDKGWTAIPNQFSKVQQIKLQTLYPDIYEYDKNSDILYVKLDKYNKAQIMSITSDIRRVNHFTNSINRFKK